MRDRKKVVIKFIAAQHRIKGRIVGSSCTDVNQLERGERINIVRWFMLTRIGTHAVNLSSASQKTICALTCVMSMHTPTDGSAWIWPDSFNHFCTTIPCSHHLARVDVICSTDGAHSFSQEINEWDCQCQVGQKCLYMRFYLSYVLVGD